MQSVMQMLVARFASRNPCISLMLVLPKKLKGHADCLARDACRQPQNVFLLRACVSLETSQIQGLYGMITGLSGDTDPQSAPTKCESAVISLTAWWPLGDISICVTACTDSALRKSI